MGFLQKLFRTQKDKQDNISFKMLRNVNEVFVDNTANLPFIYLKDEHSCDIDKLSEIADFLKGAAMATSKQFEDAMTTAKRSEKEGSHRVNNHMVHYLFDLYLYLHSGMFHYEYNISSAVIDGIHFKYYGQPSQKIISTQLQLWAEKERCFLNSFFSIFKGNDYPRLLVIYADYCMSDNLLRGATEGLVLSKRILNLIEVISPKIKAEISNIL